MRLSFAVPLVLMLGLGACATALPEAQWQPREGANLAADQDVCRKVAGGIDVSAYGGQSYSDGRYGAAAAMANRLDRDSIRGGGSEKMYMAIFEDCMGRKGWTKAQ